MKTIRQISDSTGISKVSLYKLIKKPEMESHIKKNGKTILIDDVGEQIIIEYYSRQQLTTLNDILNESIEESSEIEGYQGVNQVYSPDFIGVLEKQLTEKDKQIQVKDEQIRQKDSQLNALLILLNKEKDIRLISASQSIMPTPEVSPTEVKEGFFKRLFGKK